ncbi:protein phosphatase 1 regulatory subunit 13 like L homeolog isoform X3 [Xenopus laevis]|uniref:Protein phosphatase 1 regulatory subunit 13 like L homeolog isoform X3 n=1 Tax=Xenopus laevis TaxID=8355 RepID=A0A8J1LF22_XENLA|nr:protein phosphatase 1 regulatory subunit 13 like L homeolog isoform X3 [Xenopus laevis]
MVQTQPRPKHANFGSVLSLSGGKKIHSKLWTKLIGWRDTFRKMSGEKIRPTQSLLDINFQSLASQELDLKQMELDSATAKLDELKRDLENRREPVKNSNKEGLQVSSQQTSSASLSPALTRRAHSSPSFTPLIATPSLKPRLSESSMSTASSHAISSSASVPSISISSTVITSPSMARRSIPTERVDPYHTLNPQIPLGRPSSPRHQYYDRPHTSSTRLSSSPYDYAVGPRIPAPSLEGHSGGMYSDWGSLQRRGYEVPHGYTSRFPDDVSSPRRRQQQRIWNESDLDVAYDKKPPQGSKRGADHGIPSSLPIVKAWKESSLDPASISKGDSSSSTLPRGYKFSTGAEPGFQGGEPGWRAGTGSLPRSIQAQQPISRIQVPPPEGRGQPHRPLPLSMICHLQNAFWEHQTPPLSYGMFPAPTVPTAVPTTVPTAVSMPPVPSVPLPMVPEWELPAVTPVPPPTNEEVPRPLSPTRLQPNLPPSLAEVQKVLEDIPRPLRRRGSQELAALASPLPSHRRQYQQIMGRLFGRATPKQSSSPEQPKAEDKLQGSAVKFSISPKEPSLEVDLCNKIDPIPEEIRTDEKIIPDDKLCVILETSDSRVGTSAPVPGDVEFKVPLVIGGSQNLGLRSALKGRGSPHRQRPPRARLDPLILLLDAALTGEMDVVNQALKEVNDPSQPNEEGITALHNAICGANDNIVNLLVSNGANVNAEDSHGWTPLHCAASCNDLEICLLLVRHGAAIFATTHSDGSLAVEKCDPYRERYQECINYLTDVGQCMGEAQSGVVYALWDYSAEFADELSLKEGDTVTVLRKDGEGGSWWWASLCGREGYVPRNYFGLYPRVRSTRSPK